jgi:hypothetical protein
MRRLLMGFLPIATAIRVHAYPAAIAMSTFRSTSGLHRAAHRIARMAGDFNGPDVTPNFAQKELAATWERAGKGRELWKPGDKTDSPLSDARLLFTTWKLNPLELHIYDHCPFCLRARLVLGWLQARYHSEPGHTFSRRPEHRNRRTSARDSAAPLHLLCFYAQNDFTPKHPCAR